MAKKKRSWMTPREFGELVGISQQQASTMCTQGRLGKAAKKVNGRWQISPEAARRALEENTAQGNRQKRTRAEEDDPGEIQTFAQARAENERLKAKLRRLEYEREKGLLIKREDVERGAFQMYRTAREAILNIPARIAAELVQQEDVLEIERRLRDHFRAVLEDLSAGTERYRPEGAQ